MEWGSVKQSFYKTQDQARLVFKTVFQHFSASILDILREKVTPETVYFLKSPIKR